jgi:hypothetical protein
MCTATAKKVFPLGRDDVNMIEFEKSDSRLNTLDCFVHEKLFYCSKQELDAVSKLRLKMSDDLKNSVLDKKDNGRFSLLDSVRGMQSWILGLG